MGTQRSYSAEFKRHVVEELLAGAKRPARLRRERGIDHSTLRTRREQYARHGVAAWGGAPTAATAREGKVAELGRIVGQLTVGNMVLEKAAQRAQSLSASSAPSSGS